MESNGTWMKRERDEKRSKSSSLSLFLLSISSFFLLSLTPFFFYQCLFLSFFPFSNHPSSPLSLYFFYVSFLNESSFHFPPKTKLFSSIYCSFSCLSYISFFILCTFLLYIRRDERRFVL